MLDHRLTVRVSQKTWLRIQALAEQRRSSLAKVLQEAIDTYLEKTPDPGSVAHASQETDEEIDGVAGPHRRGADNARLQRRKVQRLFARIDAERDAILARRGGVHLDDPVTLLDELREENDAGAHDTPEDAGR